MRIALTAIALVLATATAEAKEEVEIEFRYHHDGDGNSQNQSVAIEYDDDDDDVVVEVTVDTLEGEEQSDGGQSAYFEILSLIQERLQAFRLEAGTEVDRPRIEVKLEYKGEDRELEISETYAAGSLPDFYVAIQEQYFDEVWK